METGSKIGVAPACLALGLPRATYYRRLRPKPVDATAPASDGDRPSRPQPRALPPEERQQVLAVLNEPRFMDQAPPQVHATLLDESRWLCSLRTMYRILDENGQVRERRDQLRHPEYKKPELLATRPNQVWTWDITKLLGPAKWTYFYLYVILDIFSRSVVGFRYAWVFTSLRQIDRWCADFMQLYNRDRPRSSYGGLTPDEVVGGSKQASPPLGRVAYFDGRMKWYAFG